MRWKPALAAVAAVALATGCGGGSPGLATSSENAVTPNGKHVRLSTPGVPKGQQTVRLKVITTRGRDTIALVPVYINGRGPYPFALDTGASQSLIDTHLVRALRLPTSGSRTLRGVTGSGKGQNVEVMNWRAGGVRLHADTIASLNLMGPGGNGPAGLLGSDVLSRFGKIAVDYDKGILLLDPHVR